MNKYVFSAGGGLRWLEPEMWFWAERPVCKKNTVYRMVGLVKASGRGGAKGEAIATNHDIS